MTETVVYLEVCKNGESISLSLESLVILHLYDFIKTDEISLSIRFMSNKAEISIPASALPKYNDFSSNDFINYCRWPVVRVGQLLVAGLASVARQIVKSSKNASFQHLLGFRESCLVACSETSIWTKFCEVDMISSVKHLLSCNEILKIPESLVLFEYHLAQPVKIHNIYKVASEQSQKVVGPETPKNHLNLAHNFAEGPFITLADVLLYPCVDVIFKLYENIADFKTRFPLCSQWYHRMTSLDLVRVLASIPLSYTQNIELVEPTIVKYSLYKSDSTRYKPQKRIFTKQCDIVNSLNIVHNAKLEIRNDHKPFGFHLKFSWDSIPLEINPTGGSLPQSRAKRKCEQLENFAKSVVKLAAGDKYTIVDFCSGSGHLGLLLAFLLPQCQIILVENKEHSLARAISTIHKLQLKNVACLQCNLDYFSAQYDIGVSLHACGVATDLVMKSCIENKAHFVCCPCCYGGIKDCHVLTYPRSPVFGSFIGGKDYFNLAHAADQTHDADNLKTKQGYLCMNIVDYDRKLYAESQGYDVHLGKLQPETCTNKNNLLVGICKDRII